MTTRTASTTLSTPAAPGAVGNDPRPHWFRALDWVAGLAAAVPEDRMGDPTPCEGFDVRTLLGHLVTTARRPRAIAEGADPMKLPLVSTDLQHTGPAAAYADEVAALRAGWGGAEGSALLERTVRVPWGEVPGREALGGYLNETLVHGWDLAVATGQDPEADPDLAEAVLAVARTLLPAEMRGGPVPFGAVVTPAPDAGPTERLANWSGHRR
ncbi:TIGR03086 family metal-binding protein [Pseudonocardia sp. KRD291]|uniref:TIGR03086 family metal-binding protein n=1 Tax=Pseudonocardia sp. KRD291 TaxID=2792007 RepID=UPI001C4A2DDE|nr:TIGR03086 family metal-binding protein [Pseudonocardia sp. KRD291]MBW0103248.1 TIGR03086 family protein [Pseudonocardia sp. KRD291]